ARLVGQDNVGSPELLDTHRPGAFRIKRFSVKRGPGKTRRRGGDGATWRGNKSTGGQGDGARGRNGEEALRPATPSPRRPVGGVPFSPLHRLASSLLGFRVFRPPLRAQVETPDGWPARIKAQAAGGRSIRGKVMRLAGPWRTSGDWWSKDGWARDEWDVAIAASGASLGKETFYRIYYDLWSDGWFVEGVYD